MSCETCRYFESCSAPICPEDPESLAYCAWFSDEEICKRADYAGVSWIKRQKRIARATQKDFWRGCFTMAMLDHPCTIHSSIKGLDPEKGEISEARVKEWMSKHPPVSAKRRASARAHGFKKAGAPAAPVAQINASRAAKLPTTEKAAQSGGGQEKALRTHQQEPSGPSIDVLEKSP